MLTASRRPRGSSRSDMDDFYRDYILDHYRNPRNFGHLDQPADVRRKISIRSAVIRFGWSSTSTTES